MEDVLTDHADRVRDANERHARRAEEIRDAAAGMLRAAIDKFADAMVESARQLTAAKEAAIAAMTDIAVRAEAELDEAFTANVMAISASETAMRSAMSARQTYFATGKLPDPVALPDIADGPSMATVNDEAEPERAAA